jgi:hypothetical protein
MRRSTAVVSAASSASCQSSGDQPARSGWRVNCGTQNVRSCTRPSGSMTRIVAGGSFLTPRRIVRGGGTTLWKLR